MTSEDFAKQIVGMTQTLHRVCVTQLAQACDREDAVQECLRKAWEKRGKLRDARYLQTWVIRILINECHNIRRKGQRQVPVSELPLVAASTDPAAERLQNALLALEESLRLPILLHYIEGYRVEEVATMLRLPPGTIKSRLARGRNKLKEGLKEEVFAQ